MKTNHATLNNYRKEASQEAVSSSSDTQPIFYTNNAIDTCLGENSKQLERAHKVLDYIRDNEGLYVSELARRLNIPRTTLIPIIKKLEDANVVYSKIGVRKNVAIKLIYFSAEKTKVEAAQPSVGSPNLQLKKGDKDGEEDY